MLVTPDEIEAYLKHDQKITYARLPDIKQDPRTAIGNVIHRVEFLAAPSEGRPLGNKSLNDLLRRVESLNGTLNSLVPGLDIHSPPSRPFSTHPDDFGYGVIVDFGYLGLEQKVGTDAITALAFIFE